MSNAENEAPHLEMSSADMEPPIEVSRANFTKLLHVSSLQQEAAALKAEQHERKSQREELRARMRQHGARLHQEQQQQKARNTEEREKLHVEASARIALDNRAASRACKPALGSSST